MEELTFPYIIDRARRRARVTMTGSVSGRGIAETLDALYRDPQWLAGFDTLWDATGTTQLLLEADDLPALVKLQSQYQELAGGGRDVLLVARPLDHTMAKIYAFLAKNTQRPAYVVLSEPDAAQILNKA
jgi:hypothetical protein